MSYILLSYFNKFFLPLSLKNVSRHQFHQQIYRLSFKFYIQDTMWWKKWVYRDPEPNSFMSLYQHKTDVKILNVKVVRVHWVHLLCNNFHSLPSSSSAIITAWVMRQFSNNEKLEKQKKSCMSVVNHETFSIHCSGRSSSYKKSPKIVDTI